MAAAYAFGSLLGKMWPPTEGFSRERRTTRRRALGSAMASGFEILHRLEPSAFVFKAIIGAIAADVLLLAFILVRRSYRMHYFRKRDARVFELRQKWDALISGEIPYETWRTKSFDRRIIEDMALDAFEAAAADQSARLLRFFRTSGFT